MSEWDWAKHKSAPVAEPWDMSKVLAFMLNGGQGVIEGMRTTTMSCDMPRSDHRIIVPEAQKATHIVEDQKSCNPAYNVNMRGFFFKKSAGARYTPEKI